jgi:hypothetical protein
LPKYLMLYIDPAPWGHVAEWLRNGLQNSVTLANAPRRHTRRAKCPGPQPTLNRSRSNSTDFPRLGLSGSRLVLRDSRILKITKPQQIQHLPALEKVRPALGGELAARDPVGAAPGAN